VERGEGGWRERRRERWMVEDKRRREMSMEGRRKGK
jgi:hypothetical protein